MVDRTVPSRFAVTLRGGPLTGRIEWTHLGSVEVLQTNVNAAQKMVRTEDHVRRGAQPEVSLAVRRKGAAIQSQFGVDRRLRPGDLYCTDLTSPFTYANGSGGTGVGLQIPVDRLGLPMDVIRLGAARLHCSVLYPIARDLILGLADAAADIADGEAADTLAVAATELARALLANASEDSRYHADAVRQTEFTRVRRHVRRHLSDPLLNADLIAANTGITPRRLYALCRENGIRLEQWIIQQRLNRSIAMLSHPGIDPLQHQVGGVVMRLRRSLPFHPPLSRGVRCHAAGVVGRRTALSAHQRRLFFARALINVGCSSRERSSTSAVLRASIETRPGSCRTAPETACRSA